MKKTKIVVVIITALILISILLICINLINKKEDKKVKKNIEIISSKFYEKSYYTITPIELLKDFKEKGIIITLKELLEYEEESIDAYKKYDITKSKVVIYPKNPYEKTDYEIKIKLYRK